MYKIPGERRSSKHVYIPLISSESSLASAVYAEMC